MMPTADEVATAIIAASEEMSVHPIEVFTGFERVERLHFRKAQNISRARAYAARAIDKVFNRPEMVLARPSIARMVGVNEPSQAVFFASLSGRPIPWWNDAVFKRVVDAVIECEPGAVEENTQTCPQTRPAEPEPQQDQGPVVEEFHPTPPETLPPPYKFGPLPPARKDETPAQRAGHLEPGGWRPAPGTYEKVLEDDADEDEPVFDRGALGGSKPRSAPVVKSRRQMAEDLAEAVRNTAAKTPPPED